jgi:hypothetical protein
VTSDIGRGIVSLASVAGRGLQRDCPAGCLTIGGLHPNTVQ